MMPVGDIAETVFLLIANLIEHWFNSEPEPNKRKH